MLCYDSTMEYRFFYFVFFNEEIFCLKFEQKLFWSPTFLPYILGLICMFEKCQKDSALVSLNVIALLSDYVLPVYLYFVVVPNHPPPPRLKRLNTSPMHVLVVKVRWVHGTSRRFFFPKVSGSVFYLFFTFSNKKRNISPHHVHSWKMLEDFKKWDKHTRLS